MTHDSDERASAERALYRVKVANLLCKIAKEVDRATAKHPSMCSAHHGYAVIKEELDELATGLDSLLADLRLLAVQDPKKARAEVVKLVHVDPERARSLLDRLNGPQDARLRNVVANVATDLDLSLVTPYLEEWNQTETDEFSRKAISLALSGIHSKLEKVGVERVVHSPYPDKISETYDFVASRLMHKLANGLWKAHRHLTRLASELKSDQRTETIAALNGLQEEFARWGRAVEAIDVDPTHFDIRPRAEEVDLSS